MLMWCRYCAHWEGPSEEAYQPENYRGDGSLRGRCLKHDYRAWGNSSCAGWESIDKETSAINYGVFEWPEQVGALRYTAAAFREGDELAPAKLLHTCRTWQAAARIVNRLNLEQARLQVKTAEERYK